MTFQEADSIVCAARNDLNNGTIPAHVWKAKVENLKVRDRYGNHWQYSADYDQWLMKKGKGWIRAVPDGKDPAPVWRRLLRISPRFPVPSSSPPPTSFLSWLLGMIAAYVRNLPYTLLFQLLTAVAVFFITRFIHTCIYLNVIDSQKTTQWQMNMARDTLKLVKDNFRPFPEATWALFGFLAGFLIYKIFSGSIVLFFRNLIRFPLWTASCFSNKERSNMLVLSLSITAAILSGRLLDTEFSALLVGLMLLMSFGAQRGSVLGTGLQWLSHDASRIFGRKTAIESSAPYLVLLGASIGLFIDYLFFSRPILLYAIAAFVLLLGLLIRMTRIGKQTVMMLVGFFGLSVFMASLRESFADDNSTGDYGGKWNWYNHNKPSTDALGRPAGGLGAGGSAVGGAAAGAGSASGGGPRGSAPASPGGVGGGGGDGPRDPSPYSSSGEGIYFGGWGTGGIGATADVGASATAPSAGGPSIDAPFGASIGGATADVGASAGDGEPRELVPDFSGVKGDSLRQPATGPHRANPGDADGTAPATPDKSPPAQGAQTPATLGNTSPAKGATSPITTDMTAPAQSALTPAMPDKSAPAQGAQSPVTLGNTSPAKGAPSPVTTDKTLPAQGAQTPAMPDSTSPAQGNQTPATLGNTSPAKGATSPITTDMTAPAQSALTPAMPESTSPAQGNQKPATLGNTSPAKGATSPVTTDMTAPAQGAQTPAMPESTSPAQGAQTPAMPDRTSPVQGNQTPATLDNDSPAKGAPTK